jgi:hypothetical protein
VVYQNITIGRSADSALLFLLNSCPFVLDQQDQLFVGGSILHLWQKSSGFIKPYYASLVLFSLSYISFKLEQQGPRAYLFRRSSCQGYSKIIGQGNLNSRFDGKATGDAAS